MITDFDLPLEYQSAENRTFDSLAHESSYLISKGVRSLAYINLFNKDNETQMIDIAKSYDVKFMVTDFRLSGLDPRVYHKNLFIYKYQYQKHLLDFIVSNDNEDSYLSDWLMGLMLGYSISNINDYLKHEYIERIPNPVLTVSQLKAIISSIELTGKKQFYLKDSKFIEYKIRNMYRHPDYAFVVYTTLGEANRIFHEYKDDLKVFVTFLTSKKETLLFVSPVKAMDILIKKAFTLTDMTVIKYIVARVLGYTDDYISKILV